MSTQSFTPVISKELQATVRTNSKIKEVYFDANNAHYFNVFKLRKNKEDKTPKEEWGLYGTGLFSHQQEIAGLFNVDKKKESISMGNPDTLIVCTMQRKDILTAITSDVNIHASEVASINQQLTPQMIKVLEGIANGSLVVQPSVKAAPAAPTIEEVEDEPNLA